MLDYTSFLQVVHFRSVRAAGYIANTYSFGSCVTGVILGFIIKFHGRYKIYAIIGIPIYILGTGIYYSLIYFLISGLMIHFRGPQYNQGYLIMCQIFVAIGGGVMSFLTQLAVMAVVSHQDTAAVLAILGTVTSIGGAVGLAISGAIWTNTLPEQLEQNLPASIKNQSEAIFGSLTDQLSYPQGSPGRNAIIDSYADTQKILCLAATCISVGALILVFGLRDVKLKEVKQPVKGLVV
jgi:MFS family permease